MLHFDRTAAGLLVLMLGTACQAQDPQGPGGFPPRGPRGMMREDRKLLDQFDVNKDGQLNREERDAARTFVANSPGGGRGPGGPGGGQFGPGGRGPGNDGPGGGPGQPPNGPEGPGRGGMRRGPGGPFGRQLEPTSAGVKISPSEVTPSDAPFYDPSVLRTLFLQFEDDQWEADLMAFYKSDVEVPATLTVDGKEYPQVGVHFRGMSSFMGVPAGSKHSLNISLDEWNSDQKLEGYKTLNLLNAHEDHSFLHTVLYFHIARNFLAAPQANFARVVINGENWGLYTNAQQFDKTFAKENFRESNGARWKVPGSPGGRGGLEYLGENVADYKKIYEIKSKDDEKSWQALVTLCKTLDKTPPKKLAAALEPMLDIDSALWFLALENVLINSDGYWIRASDYSIYLDEKGRFHILPHDANETFQAPMGPPGGMRGGRGGMQGPGRGFGPDQRGGGEGTPPDRRLPFDQNGPPGPGGPGGFGNGGPMGPGGPGGPGGPFGGGPPINGVELDPLVGMEDATKPLRSKLLAVPELKEKYLQHVRTLAEEWLAWEKLGPVVESYAALIDEAVEQDTRKLSSYADFQKAVSTGTTESPPPGGREMSIKNFAEQRRKYLLNLPEIQKLK